MDQEGKAAAKRGARRSGSLLGAYAGSFPAPRRLGRREEAALTRRAAAGDAEALGALIEANFALLVKTALGFRRSALPLEDLLGEATSGLIEAVGRFDPERGFRFMTYAVWWVRRALVRAVATQSRNVRIPRHQAAASPGAPWPREVSLSEESPGDAATRLEDLLEDEQESADETLHRSEERAALGRALEALPARERFVLEERFGLVDDEPRTLLDIAGELGVSKERVRQLEGQALERLTRGLRSALNPA